MWIPKNVIEKVMEENMDSQASAMLILESLRELSKALKKQEHLKRLVSAWMKKAGPKEAQRYSCIYKTLCETETTQKDFIVTVARIAIRLRKLNYLSNGLLLPYLTHTPPLDTPQHSAGPRSSAIL